MRVVAGIRRHRVRTELASNERMGFLVFRDGVEIPAFAPMTGPHDVPRYLCPAPYLGGETNRASSRRAILHAPVVQSNRHQRNEPGESTERAARCAARLNGQILDTETVLIRQECCLETDRFAGELRLTDDQPRGRR